MNNKVQIEISALTILKFFAILIGLVVLYLIRDILAILFLVGVLVAAFYPLVDRLEKARIPRVVSVTIIYFLFLAILIGMGFLIIPPVVVQLQDLSNNLPYYVEKISPQLYSYRDILQFSQQGLTQLSQTFSSFSARLYSTTVGFVSGIVSIITVLVVSFYLLLDTASVKKFLISIFPVAQQPWGIEAGKKIAIKMGSWLGGQFLLGLIIGILDLSILLAFGIPYALTLGLWGGLTEVIPFIGPWLGGIPAVLVALSLSPWKAVGVAIAYIVVQQLESQLLAPRILGKAVGLSPVIIIFAILIGAKLYGLIGIILAIPAAAAIAVLVGELPKLRQHIKESEKVN